MKPKLHFILYLLFVWGGAITGASAAVVAWNSVGLSFYTRLSIVIGVMLYLACAGNVYRKFIPIRCPICHQKCIMQIKPKIYYRCRQCDYRWETGVGTGTGDSKPS